MLERALRYRAEAAALAVVALLLGLIGMVMARWEYDTWAAVAIGPMLVVVTLVMLRHVLGDDLGHLFTVLAVGYVAKLVGACLRYYVVFDAYGKNGDAERYFDTGSTIAAAVRSGRASVFTLLPLARDTAFIEKVSGFVLTVLGPTRLGGFFVFSTFAYWGTVNMVRAACIAVPDLVQRRYAALCVFAPSLMFWPSSLGKEAWMIGCAGFFSLGLARVLVWYRRASSLVLMVAAAIGIGAVRPHMAALFVGAATVAFLQSVIVPPEAVTLRRRGSQFLFLAAAVAGLVVAFGAAVRYLSTDDGNDSLVGGITGILNRATEQTQQGGSSFSPIDIDNPLNWPLAIARTLTRPLLIEATSIASFIPAVETTAFLVALVLGWRRLLNLPHTVRTSPYLLYMLLSATVFGLTFSAISNLGILVRQRSLVVAFIVVLLCVPPRPYRLAPQRPPLDVHDLLNPRATLGR